MIASHRSLEPLGHRCNHFVSCKQNEYPHVVVAEGAGEEGPEEEQAEQEALLASTNSTAASKALPLWEPLPLATTGFPLIYVYMHQYVTFSAPMCNAVTYELSLSAELVTTANAETVCGAAVSLLLKHFHAASAVYN